MRRKELWQKIATRDCGVKQYKYLYRRMLDDEVIRKAYKKLRKGKTKRVEVIAIDADLDAEVEAMKCMIENTKPPGIQVENPELAYKPKMHKPKFIHEHGKTRKIYMPEIHEQWLHHIIVLVLEPIIMATAYPFSCGSFPNRGAHYGKRRMERWIKTGKGLKYFGKVDIRHFYDSIQIEVLMKELSIRIKDSWFLHIIRLCLEGFKKGIPLGFYISQWLANYILEPLDRMMTERLGIQKFVRYMDDMVFFSDNKKTLHKVILEIRKMLGRRFRLKLKHNFQVCKFDFKKKNGKRIGRPVDFMGFVFYRNRTVIRESILLAATRLAAKMDKAKESRRGYYERHVKAMLSYMGWFTHSDTYNCYLKWIKPRIHVGRLKKIVSKLDRRRNKDEAMERRALCGAA